MKKLIILIVFLLIPSLALGAARKGVTKDENGIISHVSGYVTENGVTVFETDGTAGVSAYFTEINTPSLNSNSSGVTFGAINVDSINGVVWADSYSNLNSAVSSGASVIILSSGTTYTITTQINISSNQAIIGPEDRSAVILWGGSSTYDDYFIANTGQSIYGSQKVTLKNFKIDGSGATVSGIRSYGSGNTDWLIENVWVDNCRASGIFLDQTWNAILKGVKVTRYGYQLSSDNGTATGDGIRLNKAADFWLESSFIDNRDIITTSHKANESFGRHGITIGTNTTVGGQIINPTIYRTERHGINLEGDNADKVMVVGPRIFEAGTYSAVLSGYNGTFTGFYIEDAGEVGIRINAPSGASSFWEISNGEINRSGVSPNTATPDKDHQSGIYFSSSNLVAKVNNVQIMSPVGDGVGFHIERGIVQIDNSGVSNSPTYGYWIQSSPQLYEAMISNSLAISCETGFYISNPIGFSLTSNTVRDSNGGFEFVNASGTTGVIIGNKVIEPITESRAFDPNVWSLHAGVSAYNFYTINGGVTQWP